MTLHLGSGKITVFKVVNGTCKECKYWDVHGVKFTASTSGAIAHSCNHEPSDVLKIENDEFALPRTHWDVRPGRPICGRDFGCVKFEPTASSHTFNTVVEFE